MRNFVRITEFKKRGGSEGFGERDLLVNPGRERGTGSHFIRRAAMVVLVVALAAVVPGKAEEGKSSVTERANQLEEAGQVSEAVQLLQTALARHPEDLNARVALAEIYARHGQATMAEEEFREALSRSPASSAAALALGGFYLATGSLASAEQVLLEATHRNPRAMAIREQLATVLAGEHKYAEANTQLCLVPPPAASEDRVRYFRLAASIHSGLGDSRAAAEAIEKALQAKPSDAGLQLIAAFAEAEAGEWSACLKHVTPIFERHPASNSGILLLRAQLASHKDFTPTLQALRNLDLTDQQKLQLRIRSAEVLAAYDQHRSAVAELEGALKLAGGENDTLLYNLAVEQFSAGQSDQAFSTLAPLQAQNDSAEIEDLLGDIEEEKGDAPAAIQSHEAAVKLDPRQEKYRLSLGAELLKYGRYESAAAVFQKATELAPNSARIYVGLGMADYFMEKYDESVAAFLRADQLDGGSGRALNYLGATQLDSSAGPTPTAVSAICRRPDAGDAKPATDTWCSALRFRQAYLAGDRSAVPDIIRSLRAAATLAPGNPVANCELGRALEWTGQLADARRCLEICVRLKPDSTEDRYHLSRVYQGLGLKQAAAEQAALIDKASGAQDQDHALAQQFAHEVLGSSKPGAELK